MADQAPQDRMLLGTANSDGTFTGVTVDETTSIELPPSSHQLAAIVIIGNGTTSSGVIKIEEAFHAANCMPYSGTWSELYSVNASDVTGGAQKIVHLPQAALFPIRVRISTVIGGGGGISAALRYQ